MTLSIAQATTKDLGFAFSLAQNGARHGHFDARIIIEKDAYRNYLISAITKEADPRGYPTRIFVANLNKDRIGATVVTQAIGTPDEGVEIAMISLKKEHREKGYGSKILDSLLDRYLTEVSVYARCLPASGKFKDMLLRRDFSEVGMSEKSVVLRHGAIGKLTTDTSVANLNAVAPRRVG